MSEENYIDFKKEFEEFKKELEKSKPIFDDDSIEFADFDNLISNKESINPFDAFDDSNDYPKIALETDDISMNITIKKDYSSIDDLEKRKEEFFKDLREFLDEFELTEDQVN